MALEKVVSHSLGNQENQPFSPGELKPQYSLEVRIKKQKLSCFGHTMIADASMAKDDNEGQEEMDST